MGFYGLTAPPFFFVDLCFLNKFLGGYSDGFFTTLTLSQHTFLYLRGRLVAFNFNKVYAFLFTLIRAFFKPKVVGLRRGYMGFSNLQLYFVFGTQGFPLLSSPLLTKKVFYKILYRLVGHSFVHRSLFYSCYNYGRR